MMKERAMAIFIGLIMIFSVAGFSLMSIRWGSNTGNTPVDVPSVIDKALTKDEFRSILLSGKTIIQNHYLIDCADCGATNAALEGFAKDMAGFVVLEQFSVQFQNETKLQVVSSDGRITELGNGTINQDSLLDTICAVSYVQPKQCLLRGIGNQQTNVSL